MPELVAYCGLDFNECRPFKATQAKDGRWKEQIAKQWTEELEVESRLEDIDCCGCKSDTISTWCRRVCKLRPCAEERKVTTCAHCNDYPCDKLKEFLTNEPESAKNLEQIQQKLQV